MIQEAYIRGFMTKCAQEGLSEEDVSRILSRLGTQFGANPVEETSENDYKSGIGDAFRNIWKSPEVMAEKQRRFEKDYKKSTGLGKIWRQIKHPARSVRAEGTSGAIGFTGGAAAGIVATAIARALAAKRGGAFKGR